VMALWDETGALKKKITSRQMASEKATIKQWELIQLAITAFKAKYTFEWNVFEIDQKSRKNDQRYWTAKEGDLKKSNYRHTASFPVILRTNPETGEQVVVHGLLPVLEKIIPGLTKKESKNFIPFLKRYPIFNPGEKIGASE